MALDITEVRRTESELRNSLIEKETLLKEVHHRVKNNMQIMYSLIGLQLKKVKEPLTQEQLRTTQQRIRAMALIHEKLYQSENLSQIELSSYLADLCQFIFQTYYLQAQHIGFEHSLDSVKLNVEKALPCGLIVNELVSNALKYAFPNRSGALKILLQLLNNGKVLLQIADDGAGLPKDFQSEEVTSMGLNLVYSLVRQLRGKITVSGERGTCFQITFPVN